MTMTEALSSVASEFGYKNYWEMTQAVAKGVEIMMPPDQIIDGVAVSWLERHFGSQFRTSQPNAPLDQQPIKSLAVIELAASRLKKRDNVSKALALDHVADDIGFENYAALERAFAAGEKIYLPECYDEAGRPMLWLKRFGAAPTD